MNQKHNNVQNIQTSILSSYPFARKNCPFLFALNSEYGQMYRNASQFPQLFIYRLTYIIYVSWEQMLFNSLLSYLFFSCRDKILYFNIQHLVWWLSVSSWPDCAPACSLSITGSSKYALLGNTAKDDWARCLFFSLHVYSISFYLFKPDCILNVLSNSPTQLEFDSLLGIMISWLPPAFSTCQDEVIISIIFKNLIFLVSVSTLLELTRQIYITLMCTNTMGKQWAAMTQRARVVWNRRDFSDAPIQSMNKLNEWKDAVRIFSKRVKETTKN